MDIYSTKTYHYDLPEELIAQTPIEPRDHSRMLVYDRSKKTINHKHFYDVIDYLNEGDVLVVNNTKVLPCRLFGTKVSTGAKAEVFLLKKRSLNVWEVLLKPQRRLKEGTIIEFSKEFSCKVLENFDHGNAIVEFTEASGTFEENLLKVGNMPLPHYIHEKLKDKNRYQTVYAKTEGSSAAPTAGLHFTPELLEKIKNKGIKVVEVLLHVGLGTFRPVSEENILNHDMHTEHYEIKKEVAETINEAKKNGHKIIAVGTTSVRTLESVAEKFGGELKEDIGETKIFIYPGFKWKIIDHLITNFHLPESTLIMLVSSFCGIKETLGFYNEAVREKYRFYSFGDSCLLL
ncbi:MAG: tRNA preQ1(34) S-adenosylmethionine ribosyltransferase-isomerase QueA [Clostridiales bacterium]|nr:tRNA preQ1(34) S-adenosylmethionine ribosyltransferase-isomerase QueA [Candidatus Apopatousia equi]